MINFKSGALQGRFSARMLGVGPAHLLALNHQSEETTARQCNVTTWQSKMEPLLHLKKQLDTQSVWIQLN